MSDQDIKNLYNDQAEKWSSDEARTISDLVGRAEVLEMCKEAATDKVVLDLGCGEGYMGRKIATFAKKLIGVDLSEEMIRLANEKKGSNEEYLVSGMNQLGLADENVDLAVAVMSIHYLEHFDDLVSTFAEVRRVLKKEGGFIFLVPHPLGSLINEESRNYLHEKFDFNYSQDEGRYFKWKVQLLNRQDALDVGSYFHPISSYSKALAKAGFAITDIFEPFPNKELVEKHQAEVEERIPYFLTIRAHKLASDPEVR